MKAPSREELLAGTADAEQVLQPGSWWHYSNLAFALLGEVVARAHGSAWEEALRERILDPLALSRTTPESAEPAARGYFVEPYSDSVRLERDLDLGGSGALGRLWSTTGDLARWGSFLAAGDDRVLKAATLEEMSHVRVMVDHERWALGWGTGPRALSLGRAPVRRPRRRDAGPSRGSGRQPEDEGRRGRADEHRVGRWPGAARARPRGRRDRSAARRDGRLAAGRAAARRGRAVARPLVDRGPRDRDLLAQGAPRGEARSAVLPAGTSRISNATGRTVGASPRAASAASCCASCATRPAGSRSSTSRRTRCGASPRRSSDRRRRRTRRRCRRRRRSGSRP